MTTIPDRPTTSADPQPAWDVALLFPSQGEWSEDEYLGLDTNRLVELIDGNLEVLPMPTFLHQQIVWFLAEVLRSYVSGRKLGDVVFAPMPIRIRDKTFREPDVIFISKEHEAKPSDKTLSGASLVMEVVSADDKSQKRDYQHKRSDYAELGIPEYWIVDPQIERITVLALEGRQYRVHGEFVAGQVAESASLVGFAVAVSDVLAAGRKSS
jgi:Uma2 family endonuclease